jgi:hypothetical protein
VQITLQQKEQHKGGLYAIGSSALKPHPYPVFEHRLLVLRHRDIELGGMGFCLFIGMGGTDHAPVSGNRLHHFYGHVFLLVVPQGDLKCGLIGVIGDLFPVGLLSRGES